MSYYIKIKKWYFYLLEPVLKILKKTNIHTNFFTLLVFIFTSLTVFFLLTEQLNKAGASGIILFICDILGSLLYEESNNKNSHKALLDSIIDRYSEIIFYTGIIVYFIQLDDFIFSLFSFLTLIASLMSSFIIIRSKEFGVNVNFGLIRRPERILISSIGMFFGAYIFGIFILVNAILSNITSFYLLSKVWFYNNKKKL